MDFEDIVSANRSGLIISGYDAGDRIEEQIGHTFLKLKGVVEIGRDDCK